MNKQVANVQLMQKMNRLKVLNFLKNNPNSSRPQIAKSTGLSLPSITNITSYLLNLGIICENGTENVHRVGRKSVLLRICPSKYNLICVFLNEKNIIITRTDLEGKIKKTIRLDMKKLSSDTISTNLAEEIISLINNTKSNRVLGIGIAISGLVLSDSRFIMSSRLKLKNFNIKSVLEEKTGIPVFIDNVSILKAAHFCSRKDVNPKENILFVDLENGIGAVHYTNGSIQRTTLGEIGHTTVEKDGPLCFCGNHGCLETMCSPGRLKFLYEELSGSRASTLEEIDKRYKCGDGFAKSAVKNCGRYLGIGLATLVNLFNPSMIVINTGDFSDCPSLLDEAENEIKARAYIALTENLIIERIYEGEEHAISGTALDLFDKLFDISFPKNIIE